ncbi:DUF6308 family protein [Arthrobacter rhombi]|uniref:DUF6308 family protein n=1 Tax=Arthrobacter rhombi TaxID=71253 RepID=UPI003FD236B4
MTSKAPQQLGQETWAYLRNRLANDPGDEATAPSDRAVGYLRTYLTGIDPVTPDVWPAIGRRFDQLAMPDNEPNVITATDLMAVSFLSVNVPPRAAWTLLTSRAAELTQTLTNIPADLAIEDADCSEGMYQKDAELQKLWNLLRRDENGQLWRMGATTVSKVMARKRPGLVPIQDRVVMRELGAADRTYWDRWWQTMHLQIDGKSVVTDFARTLRQSVPKASHLSLLRTLDIIIWMNGVYGPKTP